MEYSLRLCEILPGINRYELTGENGEVRHSPPFSLAENHDKLLADLVRGVIAVPTRIATRGDYSVIMPRAIWTHPDYREIRKFARLYYADLSLEIGGRAFLHNAPREHCEAALDFVRGFNDLEKSKIQILRYNIALCNRLTVKSIAVVKYLSDEYFGTPRRAIDAFESTVCLTGLCATEADRVIAELAQIGCRAVAIEAL